MAGECFLDCMSVFFVLNLNPIKCENCIVCGFIDAVIAEDICFEILMLFAVNYHHHCYKPDLAQSIKYKDYM